MLREQKNEWAFIGADAETLHLAHGPFKRVASCPVGETAFYQNTFDLSNPTPWMIPKEIIKIHPTELPSLLKAKALPPLKWNQPQPQGFSQVFQDIAQDISLGRLKKSVPIVTEKATLSESYFPSLLSNLFPLHENLTPYGFFSEGRGFIGASPEFLFQSYEGKLKSMALAGTATTDERDIFASDQKEIREHEFVAESLLQSLTSLGMTRRHDRKILSLGSLIHFHTAIDVELYQSHSLDDLIKHLHPTPALGPLPRTEQTMDKLVRLRQSLGCPTSFGAPFGLYNEGHFNLLVAIRMISYEQDHAILPAGCGVIEASRLTNEWRELELKRNSVKKLFRIT